MSFVSASCSGKTADSLINDVLFSKSEEKQNVYLKIANLLFFSLGVMFKARQESLS